METDVRHALATLLLMALLFAGCNAEEPADSDKDGLSDNEEEAGWEILVWGPTSVWTAHVDSNPHVQDTDGDGVLDIHELALGMDPRSKDTDMDGLSDCEEVQHTVRAECEDPLWEGETDGGYGTVGHRADSDPGGGRYVRDHLEYLDESGGRATDPLWGDGILDGDEVHGYTVQLPGGITRHVTSDPLRRDSDDDNLEDGEEALLYGSDPTVMDTDGDGCVDGLDPLPSLAEEISLGLESFTWTEPGASGTVDAILLMAAADAAITHPMDADAPLRLRHGIAYDLAAEDVPSVRPAQCSFPPYEAWIRLDLQIVRDDVEGVRGLDFRSDHVPEGVSVWWNLQSNEMRWNPADADGWERPAEPFVWSGPDGTLVWHPHIKTTDQNT